jgi:hypothetical protein
VPQVRQSAAECVTSDQLETATRSEKQIVVLLKL